MQPVSSRMSCPAVGVQLHCLPSSVEATKAESHPSGLQFSLICRLQSLFELMTYGLTVLVCSFVVIAKIYAVTGKLPKTVTPPSLFQRSFQDRALCTANKPLFYLPALNRDTPQPPTPSTGILMESNIKAPIQT